MNRSDTSVITLIPFLLTALGSESEGLHPHVPGQPMAII